MGAGKSIARLLLGGASGSLDGVSDALSKGNASDSDLYNALAKLQFQQAMDQSDPQKQAYTEYLKARTAALGRQGSSQSRPGLEDVYRGRLPGQIRDYNEKAKSFEKSQDVERLGEQILREQYDDPTMRLTRQRFEEGPTEEPVAPGGLLGGMLKTAAVPLQGALDLSAGVGSALTGDVPKRAPNLAQLFEGERTEKAIPVSYPSIGAERPVMPQELQLADEYGADIGGQIFKSIVEGQAAGVKKREMESMIPPKPVSQGTLGNLAVQSLKGDIDPNEIVQTMQGFGQALNPQQMGQDSSEAIRQAILPQIQELIPTLEPNAVIIYDTESGEAYPVDRTEVNPATDIVIYAN